MWTLWRFIMWSPPVRPAKRAVVVLTLWRKRAVDEQLRGLCKLHVQRQALCCVSETPLRAQHRDVSRGVGLVNGIANGQMEMSQHPSSITHLTANDWETTITWEGEREVGWVVVVAGGGGYGSKGGGRSGGEVRYSDNAEKRRVWFMGWCLSEDILMLILPFFFLSSSSSSFLILLLLLLLLFLLLLLLLLLLLFCRLDITIMLDWA